MLCDVDAGTEYPYSQLCSRIQIIDLGANHASRKMYYSDELNYAGRFGVYPHPFRSPHLNYDDSTGRSGNQRVYVLYSVTYYIVYIFFVGWPFRDFDLLCAKWK